MNKEIKENIRLLIGSFLGILIWVSVWNLLDFYINNNNNYYWYILITSILLIYFVKGEFIF